MFLERVTARALLALIAGAAVTVSLGQSLAVEGLTPDKAVVPALGIQVAQAAAAGAVATAGNVAAGQQTFMLQCRVCHTVEKGGPERFGPNLFGVVGKQAGTEPNFIYSEPFKKAATWKWEPALIGGWISNPAALIPGNAMAVFPGVADKDRDNVIAYLASLK
jgi:cytochrome c